MFVGSTYCYADPFVCVPFAKIRSTSDSVVNNLIDLFDRKSAEETDNQARGFVFITDTPCIVPVSGTLSHYVYYYLKDLGLVYRHIEQNINGRNEWCGIVDELHSNKAFGWMLTSRECWKDISWLITGPRGGFPVE